MKSSDYSSNEKGLLMAKLEFRKPMVIDFINKTCSKIIKYT